VALYFGCCGVGNLRGYAYGNLCMITTPRVLTFFGIQKSDPLGARLEYYNNLKQRSDSGGLIW